MQGHPNRCGGPGSCTRCDGIVAARVARHGEPTAHLSHPMPSPEAEAAMFAAYDARVTARRDPS